MTTIAKRQPAAEIQPYPPSFIDRFMNFIQRLPVPYWLTYLVLFLMQSILMHIVAWADGWLPAFTTNTLIFLFPIWQWLPFVLMTFLESASIQALSTFSPLLNVDEGGLKKLEYKFLTMPSRGVILSSLFWAIVYAGLTVISFKEFYVSYRLGTISTVVVMLEGLLAYFTGSAIYYYSIRVLNLVNYAVKLVKQFNLYRLDPIYAFSRLTALIGVSWMVMLSFTLLLFPTQLVTGVVLAILVLQVVLAIAAFVLPLWFVHRRLDAEKRRLLAEFNRQVESTSAKLHRYLDDNEMGPVTQLKDALLGLATEREILKDIPTWPWRSGTLAGFLSATILPIILFIIQFAISNILGK